jgi:hypothetical protein
MVSLNSYNLIQQYIKLIYIKNCFYKVGDLECSGLSSLERTRLMVHALGQVLSLLFFLWHLLCLDFLWTVSGLLLLHCYRHFLMRSCMMQLHKQICKWCIRCDGIWWSWLHAMEMNTLRFIGWYRGNTFLLSSQHHPRTSTTSTCHLLHSLLLLTTVAFSLTNM